MITGSAIVAFLAVGTVAFLYSAVGHAGASGYIAVMTLLSFAPQEIRPTALLLNIVVAILGTINFSRAGHFRWTLFWPFALLSVPAAFVGGSFLLSPQLLKILLGAVLLYSAVRLMMRKSDPPLVAPPRVPAAIMIGAGLGFLAGITGTGGGIFLTPLLLYRRWSSMRTAAAVSAVFILVNSVAGLAGFLWTGQPFPPSAWILAIAAVVGGAVGSHLGSSTLPLRTIYVFLAAVLTIAGMKLLFM